MILVPSLNLNPVAPAHFTFAENADKRLRRDDAMELVMLGATDAAASDFTSDI